MMPGPRVVGVGAFVPDVEVHAAALGGGHGAALTRNLGFERTYAPVKDISPFHLASGAAKAAMQDSGLRPDDVDLVIAAGHVRFEYLCWALSLAVQRELGISKALGYDLADFTGGTLLAALRAVSARFRADPRPRVALVATYLRASDLVERDRREDRWLWPVGDGGSALVVRRDGPDALRALGHCFSSDGPAGNQMTIRSLIVDEGPTPDDFFTHEWAMVKTIGLKDGEAWFADYKERSVRHLAACVTKAVQRSGLEMRSVARVQAGFLYPEVAAALHTKLGVPVETHNAHGWLGGNELAYPLAALRQEAALRGKHVVLASAWLPASYGALVLRL